MRGFTGGFFGLISICWNLIFQLSKGSDKPGFVTYYFNILVVV